MLIDPAMHRRIRRALDELPEGVRAHVEAVRRKSVALARAHGLDVARAELAADLHDLCRLMKAQELIRRAEAVGLPVSPVERAFPVFLHGPLAAELLRREYGLADEEVLAAVRWHTMGRAGMSPLEQVVFLADKLDPAKAARYPFIGEVDRLAVRDLDEAVRAFIDHQVRVFLDRGDLVHPGMIAARNDAVLALRERSRSAGHGAGGGRA